MQTPVPPLLPEDELPEDELPEDELPAVGAPVPELPELELAIPDEAPVPVDEAPALVAPLLLETDPTVAATELLAVLRGEPEEPPMEEPDTDPDVPLVDEDDEDDDGEWQPARAPSMTSEKPRNHRVVIFRHPIK